MLTKSLIFVLLAAIAQTQNILTTVDFTKNVAYTSNPIYSNFVGLSFSYQQIYSYLDNALLRGFIKNSYVYSSINTGFRVSMKMQDPKGWKNNCSKWKLYVNANTTCTRDLIVNNDFKILFNFTRAALFRGAVFSLGMDSEFANFADSNFISKIYNDYNLAPINDLMVYSSYSILQLYDQADLYQAKGIRQNFSPDDFNIEAQTAYLNVYYYLAGPGLSTNSSKAWMDTFYNWSYNGYGTFTVYAQIFNNISDVTIPNLLNQTYYKPFIQNRFTGTAGTIDTSQGKAAITDLRIVGGDGVSGVTDTMAAAIWALDFSMECALFGLRYVLFNNDLSNTTNFQAPFGSAPNFTPQAIYYGMLMMSIINNFLYSFTTQTVISGTSDSIKVYGFYSQTQQGFLFINKDTNPNASGVVQINSISSFNISCIYMSASSLSSKNITIAGYSFIPGNFSIQGNFALFNYTPDDTGYKVPLKYAQVAYCYTLVSSYTFSKDSQAHEIYYEIRMYILCFLVFLSL